MALYYSNTYIITINYASNGGGTAPASSVHRVTGSSTTRNALVTKSITVATAPSAPSGRYFTGWKVTWSGPTSGMTDKATSVSSGGGLTYKTRCEFQGTPPVRSGITATLTAQWAYYTYAVNFYGNGATSGSTAAQTKTYGQNLTLRANGFAKTGYTFIGWNTNSGATTAQYANKATYTANAAINLYAIWRKQLTLSYNANNGSGAPGAQSAYVYNSTTSYKFTIPSTRPTRTGYTFLGWSTSSTATTASYQPGAAITISSNTTLYAVWKINTWTVSYNANTGTGNVDNQTKTYGVNLTLSDGSGYSKYVHTLTGWNTAANGSGTAYELGGTYTGNAALVLYAQWHLDYIEPKVLSLNAYRVAAMEDTEQSEDGQYIRVEVTYLNGTYKDVLNESTLTIDIGGDTVHTATITDATNTIVQTFGVYSKDISYEVEINIVDSYGSTYSRIVVPTAIYPIDLYGQGQNVYMGVMHPYVMGQVLTTSTQYVDGDIVLLIDEDAGAGTLDGDLYASLAQHGWI